MPQNLSIGDRSQGYEITGLTAIVGLNGSFKGRHVADDRAVTLIQIAEDDRRSPPAVASWEQSPSIADMLRPEALVRFAGGSTLIFSQSSREASDETLSAWMEGRAALDLQAAHQLLAPIAKVLLALHARGIAHGCLSAVHVLVDETGVAQLLAPFQPFDAQAKKWSDKARAPESLSDNELDPMGDVYGLASLLYWVLTGSPPVEADRRLAAHAQRDDDPYRPIGAQTSLLPPHLAQTIDRALRLHPAMRPQSISSLWQSLEDAVAEAGTEANSASTRHAPATPPPLSPTEPTATRATTPSRRPSGVPKVPKRSRTSSLGEAPPPLPAPSSGKQPAKRAVGIGAVFSFGIALAIAWFVASGGISGSDEPPQRTTPLEELLNEPGTTQVNTQDVPPKGPQNDRDEDTSAQTSDGVLEQFCTSSFTFETARDAGTNALRQYLLRCETFDTEFVEMARDVLDLD
ncbi:MAG: hypothetical protein AAF590_01340 [Pseudomonadota bacterium]